MTGWTQERIELARDLWNEGGMSATDIGRRLGYDDPSAGKNAVISVAHRYRDRYGFMVKASKNTATVRKSRKRKVSPKPKPPTERPQEPVDERDMELATHAAPEPERAPAPGPVLFKRLSPAADRCLHRTNPPWEREVWVCGAATRPGGAFCGEHS